MNPRHILLTLLVILIWGLNFVVAKIGLATFPPLFMMAMRFFLVALLLVWFVPRPRGALFRRVMVLSLTLGSVHFSLMFTGLAKVPASVAAIAVQLQVPFAALLAAILFKDAFGWRRTLGLVLSLAGIVVITGAPEIRGDLLHVLMIVGAALVWATGNVQVKRLEHIDGHSLNAWISLLAAPQILAMSLLLEHGQLAAIRAAGWEAWGAVAYMAILVTIFGYGIWYAMIDRYSTNQTMPFTLLIPFTGVASAAAFLGEPMTWSIVLGGLLTMGGVAIILLRRPKLANPEV